jgi:predicted transcriptional regulator of viral defense system
VRDDCGGIRNAQLSPGLGKEIAELAGRQHGLVSRLQLRELGLNRYAISRRVASGILHPLHAGRVYGVSLAPLSMRARYLAAVMACGPRAALSHRSAADLWGLRPNATRIEVSVPQECGGAERVQVHRTRMLAPQDFTVNDGIPVTSVARTLLDLSAVVKAPDLATAIDRAERRRIFDLHAVAEVLDRARGRRGAMALRRAIAAYEPSTQKSKLERRFQAAAPNCTRHTDPFLQCCS